MEVERTNNEILIRLSGSTDTIGLQRLLDFLKFKEITSKSKATDNQIDEIANESKSDWWSRNKERYIK